MTELPSSTPSSAPTPYQANYVILKGDKTVGTGSRSLRQLAEGHYELHAQSKIKWMIYRDKREERSRFTLDENGVRPDAYHYRQDTTFEDVDVDLAFGADRILGRDNGQTLDHRQEEGLLDPLSYQQQMAQDLAQGKREFRYRFVQREKIKEYHFKVIGEEAVNTPHGLISALRVDRIQDSRSRETRFWLWPEQDYMLVRLLQIRKGKPFLELQLQTLSMN